MKKLVQIFIIAGSVILSSTGRAAVTPLSVAIVPPVQFPASDFSVAALRISVLWGHHRDLWGLDLGGIGNITDQTFTGSALSGVFNATHGTTHILGLQAAGLANINTEKTYVYGLQLALGLNVNTAQSTVAGVQLALANHSPFTAVYGAQLGIFNKAQDVYGVQIGLVNVATNLHGVQIGLANFNAKGPFVISPLLNVGW